MSEPIPAPFEFDVEEMSVIKDTALVARFYTFDDFPCLDGGEDPTEEHFNVQQVATGQMFVRAVNAHEGLIEALTGMLAEWDKLTRYGSPMAKAANERVVAARAALAKAKGA